MINKTNTVCDLYQVLITKKEYDKFFILVTVFQKQIMWVFGNNPLDVINSLTICHKSDVTSCEK